MPALSGDSHFNVGVREAPANSSIAVVGVTASGLSAVPTPPFMLNPNGGAVSVIGANDSAYPNASQLYMNEYYDLVFNQNKVHIGEAFALSRQSRTPQAIANDNVDLWTHYIYSLLADPEMVEHVHRVGAELDAGADLAKIRRLLEDPHLETRLHQARRRRQPAKPGADDENSWIGHDYLTTFSTRTRNHCRRTVM